MLCVVQGDQQQPQTLFLLQRRVRRKQTQAVPESAVASPHAPLDDASGSDDSDVFDNAFSATAAAPGQQPSAAPIRNLGGAQPPSPLSSVPVTADGGDSSDFDIDFD